MTTPPPPLTSLTAPWDMDPLNVQALPATVEITPAQVDLALNENLNTTFVDLFPRVDRMYKDPIISGQVYCLHSFVPTQGARPDEKGVYGFIKCRGTYATLEDSKLGARRIVENVDSAHTIYTSRTGEPFPVCGEKSRLAVAEEKDIIDIRKHAVKTISDDIRQKRQEEKKEMDEMREREKNLLEESKAAQEDRLVQDPIDVYITCHVKKANLAWTYMKMKKQLEEMVPKIRNAYAEIRAMDSTDPSLQQQYYDRYIEARKAAHVPLDDPNKDDNWMRYMCEDADFGFEV
jgi:Family of unknown function (DUF5832)